MSSSLDREEGDFYKDKWRNAICHKLLVTYCKVSAVPFDEGRVEHSSLFV